MVNIVYEVINASYDIVLRASYEKFPGNTPLGYGALDKLPSKVATDIAEQFRFVNYEGVSMAIKVIDALLSNDQFPNNPDRAWVIYTKVKEILLEIKQEKEYEQA